MILHEHICTIHTIILLLPHEISIHYHDYNYDAPRIFLHDYQLFLLIVELQLKL